MKATWQRVWITTIWVSGLAFGGAIALAWLGFLGYAIYALLQPRKTTDITANIIFCAVALVALGAVFIKFVNRFYDWWLEQRVSYLVGQCDSMVDKYQSEVSLELSETFTRQLRDSPTFQATVLEATRLVLEWIDFSSVSHTDEERKTFRAAWEAKSKKFAERVAQGDQLAVEVILKAIEKESERG